MFALDQGAGKGSSLILGPLHPGNGALMARAKYELMSFPRVVLKSRHTSRKEGATTTNRSGIREGRGGKNILHAAIEEEGGGENILRAANRVL